ncbi:MAG: LysR family transcriptional regulator [Myxococcota bacterium]
MFDALRHFMFVIEEGTFSGAARAAHLTQPALSSSIAKLESQLNCRLFDRDRRGARLTAAGAALRPHARAALAAVADGLRAVEDVEGLRRGEVTVGAGATVATYHLPQRLAQFRREHTALTLSLREMASPLLLERVADTTLDLAVVDRAFVGPAAPPPAVEFEPWGGDDYILVGGPAEERYAGQPFVTFVPGGASRIMLDRLFPDARVVVELSGVAAVKQHVRQSVGVSLLARSAVGDDLASGRMRELTHARTPVARPYAIAHRSRARLSPAARTLLELLLREPPLFTAKHR